jgi:hypothetical protein
LLVFGTLVYNEIVILPFWGFDKNTKSERDKRAKHDSALLDRKGGDDDGANYMAVSPHAAYDAARNQRKVQMKTEELQHAKYEGGLNKSEITIEETSHMSSSTLYRPNQSVPSER